MNVENVISLEAVAELLPFRAVKVTSTGIDYAGASDICIGLTLPGDLNRGYPSVQLFGKFVEAVLGNGTDVVRGDALEQAADGKLVKHSTGKIVGVAWTGATESGDRFEAIVLPTSSAAAPTFGSTNGTMAAAADLAAVKAEGELIGDDLRALRAALITAGVLR
jgi:hypothetical protein